MFIFFVEAAKRQVDVATTKQNFDGCIEQQDYINLLKKVYIQEPNNDAAVQGDISKSKMSSIAPSVPFEGKFSIYSVF